MSDPERAERVEGSGKSEVPRLQSFSEGESFEEVYRRHSSGIYETVLRMTRDAERARDLTQECFVRYLERRDTLKNPEALSGWLYRIALNLCYSLFRREKRATKAYRRLAEEESAEEQEVPSVTKQEFDAALERAMEELDLVDRSVFELSVLQRLPYRVIGEVTGLSVEAVRARLYRARKRVQPFLREFLT